MNPEIERYLQQVAKQLKSLSTTQREEELREIEQHLQALVSQEQANGRSEAEAIYSALRQFGPPRQVGRELSQAANPQLPIPIAIITTMMVAFALVRITGNFWWGATFQELHAGSGNAWAGWLILILGLSWHMGDLIIALRLRQLNRGIFWWAVSFQTAKIGRLMLLASIFLFPSPGTKVFGNLLPLYGSLLLYTFYLLVLVTNRKAYLRQTNMKRMI